jgi:hypothetical protein
VLEVLVRIIDPHFLLYWALRAGDAYRLAGAELQRDKSALLLFMAIVLDDVD